MRSYSLDVRKKIISAHEKEGISIRKVAENFNVAKSFVQKIVKRYRETGEIEARKRGGGPAPKLNGEQIMTLIEIIEEKNDATLSELCVLLEEKTGVRISSTTMWRVIQKLDYSWKKKRCMQGKKKVKEYKKSE